LNFIFGIVCLFVCVCVFSLHRESPDMILGDIPLISEVFLSQPKTNPRKIENANLNTRKTPDSDPGAPIYLPWTVPGS
jgi:hypothetical protein